MATTVKVTETYDLKTTVGKMGIVGVHTPKGEAIRRLYPGLVKSHKYIRFVKCDVVGACASILPADPLQVGVEAGAVAPEDMFNPILYKAVSNSSFDTLVSRVTKATADVASLGSVAEDIVNSSSDANFKAYYGLLAENGEFRKSMPQSGFAIKNLIPLAHTVLSTYGNVAKPDNVTVLGDDGETPVTVPDLADIMATDPNSTIGSSAERYPAAITFRGKSVKMPRFPIHYGNEAWDAIPNLDVLKTMVAVLVIPPARLHEFYYRMRISWTVRFEEVCSTLYSGDGNAFVGAGTYSYGTDYTFSSSKESLAVEENSIDATDVDITKIMES